MEEMKRMIQLLLGIPDINILAVEIKSNNHVHITVESTLEGTNCHQCGTPTTTFHSLDKPLQLRHLPMMGHQTYLLICPKRYLCEPCSNKPKTTQKPNWYDSKSRCTLAWQQHLMLALVNSTIQDVSRKEAMGYKTIEALVNRLISQKVDWEQISKLDFEEMGIDEVALRKGHKHYVTIITLRLVNGEVRVLTVLADRKKESIKGFLGQMPEALRKRLKSVCTDMYQGFSEAIREVLGAAVLVIDRFHVAKLYREAADQLRKSETRRLKKELSLEQYEELKGVMWIFRKNEQDLLKEEKAKLEKLFGYAPELEKAYRLREAMSQIFNQKLSKGKAKKAFGKWQAEVRKSGLKCFDNFLKTLDKWLEEISNYFVRRKSSGFVEGFNNKVKVLKRRSYGISNVVHFFKRLVIDVEGYQRFAAN